MILHFIPCALRNAVQGTEPGAVGCIECHSVCLSDRRLSWLYGRHLDPQGLKNVGRVKELPSSNLGLSIFASA